MKKPVSNEYVITFKLLKVLGSKIPTIIIPIQIKKIDKITKLSSNTPKNIIEITVATRGPDPLAIGYTLVKSPI